ncbi:MAG: methyltransferase FkbM family [Paenibacillus sp.]|nr:methyltransferase FkbM family [Paenibacillus sp.]
MHQCSGRPVISMSTLGRYGRFGNQIIQYAFIKLYAKRFGLQVQTPSWIGRELFGHRDEPVGRKYPRIHETKIKNKQKLLSDPYPRLVNVDIQGYFQFHTRFYAPYRADFRTLFQPVPEVASVMEQGLRRLRAKGKTVIGLHLRRGDFVSRQEVEADKKLYFMPPNEWYIQWLNSVWPYTEKPVLYIASDELESVLPDFSEFVPVTCRDLFPPFPLADYYPDHYVLSRCDMLGISSSSFSYTASMLNKRASSFLRPDQEQRKLVPYNPWNSPINPWIHLMGL